VALLSKPQQESAVARFALSPVAEFAVACACMGFSDTAARKAQLLFGNIDCNSLMPFAEAHGLIPLIYWNLNRSGLRPAGFEILEKRFRIEAHRSLLLTRELFRVLDALATNGVTALAHKGPALSCLLYGDPVLRSYADIDVLVSADEAPRARAGLLSTGWKSLDRFSAAEEQAYIRSGYEFTFRSGEATLVELHWRAAPRFYAVDFDFERMIQQATTLEVAGRLVKTLANEDLLLVLAVHGAKHLWARFSWIIDIAAFVQTTRLDWCEVIRKANTYGTERIVGTALIAASEACGVPLPAEAKPLISKDSKARPLAQELVASTAANAGTIDTETPAYFAMFVRLRERWRDRVRMLLRLAFTPSLSEWSTIRLPRQLSSFYVLVRAFRLLRRALSLLFPSTP
jgi:hypothetical protein